MEQELPTLPEHLNLTPAFSGVRVTRSLVLYVCFVLLYFFFCPLCCLFFFDIRILIAPLVSSNSSYVANRGPKCLIFDYNRDAFAMYVPIRIYGDFNTLQ